MPNDKINWKTPEMRSLLKEAVDGRSFGAAAVWLSEKLKRPVTKNTVIGASGRVFGDSRTPEEKAASIASRSWTNLRIELLRKLYAEGHYDGVIAGIINRETGSFFSPKAIVHKRSALGLSLGRKRTLRPRKLKSPVMINIENVKPKTEATHSYALCKWIDGDPKGLYSVCAQPAAIDPKGNPRSWCPHHCAIVYIKPGERRSAVAYA